MFPGLAVAAAAQRRGHDVSLWVSGRHVEDLSLGGWDGPVVRVEASGFPSGLSLRSAAAAIRLVCAFLACRSRMGAQRPDAVLGMGSYACAGPALAARSLGIPLVLHESNAVPGRAIAFLGRRADVVALGFRGAAAHLARRRTEFTGFPVRADLRAGNAEPLLPAGGLTVLVMGGSQGSHALNGVASAALCRLRSAGEPVQAVHLAGAADAGWVREAYAKAGVPHRVFDFLRDMGRAYGGARIAVARAGAATCAELAACALPALLVPYPFAQGDHQAANARELADAGGVDVILQKDLTEERLADYLAACIRDTGKLARMSRALARLAVPDAADRIVDLVERTARAPCG